MVLLLIVNLAAAINSNQPYPLGQNHVSVSYSRYVPSVLFQRTWGGSSYDSADAIALDSSGNTYVAGRTDSFCCGASFLLKYNSSGTLLRQGVLLRNNTSPYYNSAFNAITLDSSGNAYLVGYADSTSVVGRDVLLAKFDSSGNLLWQETWGGTSSDAGRGITVDRYGAIYVTGTTSSFPTNTSQSIFVLKLRANGSLAWQETWGDFTYNSGSGIAVDSSGNLYVSGYQGFSQYTADHPILLKLNSTGTLLWQERWDISNQNFFTSPNLAGAVAVDSAGSVYVTGSSNYGIKGLVYQGIPIIKFYPGGTIAWQKLWTRTAYYCCQQSPIGDSLALNPGGNVYVTGQASFYSSVTTPIGFLIVELSPDGDFEWQATTAVDNRDIGRGITVDSSGNVFAVGDINETPPPSLSPVNAPILSGNFTVEQITGKLTPTNTTVIPQSSLFLSTQIGLQTYSGQGDAYLLKLQSPTPSPPSPPLALVAQAGQNNITVSWAPSQYSGGHPITGYNIYRGTSSGDETLLANASATHVYLDSNVKSGVTYYYFVKAVNALGESDPSNENYATIGAPAGPILQINPSILGGASILAIALVALVVYQRRRKTLRVR